MSGCACPHSHAEAAPTSKPVDATVEAGSDAIHSQVEETSLIQEDEEEEKHEDIEEDGPSPSEETSFTHEDHANANDEVEDHHHEDHHHDEPHQEQDYEEVEEEDKQ